MVSSHVRILPEPSGDTSEGLAIIGLRGSGGNVVSEAGIPASPFILSGSVYVDIQGTTSTQEATNTGIVFSNTTTVDAVINFAFIDSTGNQVKSGTDTIRARTRRNRFFWTRLPSWSRPPSEGPLHSLQVSRLEPSPREVL